MTKVWLICKECGQAFQKYQCYIDGLARSGKKEPMFCSKVCCDINKTIKDPEIIETVVSAYQNGKTTKDIEKEFGIKYGTARNILIRAGISLRTPSERIASNNPTKGIGHKKETREKLSQIAKARFEGIEGEKRKAKVREKTLIQIAEGRMPKKTNTSIEIIVKEMLTSLGADFVHQHPFGYWVFDFFLPDPKVFIECDGDYWHGNPNKYKALNATQKNVIARGKQKESYAIKRGYDLVRFWEDEIISSPKTVLEKLQKLL